MKFGFDETFEEYEVADDKEYHVENEADNEQRPFKGTLDVSIKSKFAEYIPAEDKGASDPFIDFTVEQCALGMKPLVPRAGSTAAAQRPMSVDTDAASISSEKFNNDLPKLVKKTDMALVGELEPETPTVVSLENLSGVKRLWTRPFRRFRDRSTR